MTCLDGARWVQTQLLERDPDANVRVFAVWLNPYGRPPARGSWDESILPDERVTHVWDPERVVGLWLGRSANVPLRYPGDVVWDAWLVFGREGEWTPKPRHLVGFGWTVIGTRDELARKLKEVA